MIGWVGSACIVAGLWGIGSRRRGAFLFSILGNACYLWRSAFQGDGALIALTLVTLYLAVRGYVMWGRSPHGA